MAKRITAFALAFLCLCFCFVPQKVSALTLQDAKEPISLSQGCTLTAVYSHGKKTFPNLNISLYHVATLSQDLKYSYTEDFEICELPLNDIRSQSEWDAVRTTLEAYIIAYDMQPVAVGKTDSRGEILFKDLEPGLYFIPSLTFSSGKNRYSFSRALVSLPGVDPVDKSWEYTVSTSPKTDMTFYPPNTPPPPPDNPPPNVPPKDIEYKVLKLWKDIDENTVRPKNIEIDIIRNGVVAEKVFLSDENNWSYSWKSKDDGSVWSVNERNIPDGYIMTVEKRTTTFIVTNTKNPPPHIPKTGDTMNVSLYIFLICLSGVMLVILGLCGKRRTE